MANVRSIFTAFLCGLAIASIAAVFAELLASPAHGHRINAPALPAEAKAILAERPGVPVSTDQWQRLDKVMANHGGWPSGRQLLAASIRDGWYWFIALPALAAFLLRPWVASSLLSVAFLAGPSALVLSYAFLRAPLVFVQ